MATFIWNAHDATHDTVDNNTTQNVAGRAQVRTDTRDTESRSAQNIVVKSKITIHNADDLLHYEAPYKVLVCKYHQYALQNLRNHLRTEHSGTAKEKEAVANKYAGLEILKPAEVPLPSPLQQPIESLGKPRDAFICDEEECGYITVSRDEIRKHCNKKHDWRSTKDDREHWHQVYVQTFFTHGGLQRYFTVDYIEDPADGSDTAQVEVDGSNRAMQQDREHTEILDDWNAARARHEKELEIVDGNVAKTDRSLWSKRTEWPQHLAGSNFKHLAWASRLPDRDEYTLQEVAKLVDTLVE